MFPEFPAKLMVSLAGKIKSRPNFYNIKTMIKLFILSVLFVLLSDSESSAINLNTNTPIQELIDNSLEKSLQNHSPEPITSIEKSLSEKEGNVWIYWKAYTQMCKSIYFISTNQEKESQKALDSGISLLAQNDNMTTEDYALLAYMQSQYIRFTSGMQSGILSAKSKKNANMSVTKDSLNIRGWVVLAIIDYYTPKQFGGKEKCEEYLLKAIALPSQTIQNNYRPSWGKIEAYSLLLAYCKETGNKDRLHEYYQMAIKEFPNEASIKKYEND